ncbi:MAG: site-specific integrase [Stenotrophomonas nitritireducens]|uniref:site-specific integrase n=1 Tax=Stenotrophomonas nitritireducens TaxID=83617 RepID=UPI001AD5CD31|nr:site-specific integrase [Stenotrophomonas nitritireducens]MBN8768972.1 site-specific integrase [Stenotrophomonas sp.]MBN8793010.1 site-specific integrase [Stenotrophomonas nitritireducens]
MKNGLAHLTSERPPALQPEHLAACAAEAVREILAEAASANTTRSYAAALRYWAAWFQGRYGQPITLPVPPTTVVQFVVDHLARKSKAGPIWELPSALDTSLVAGGLKQRVGPLKLSTIVHRVAVLSAAHQLKKLANPCEAPEVRQLLAKGRRAAHKRGERPRKKTAITLTELEALATTCEDSLTGLRDRALLYFAFASGGRRRSEVAAADLSDLRRIGARGYVYRLEHGKTLQDGPKATSTPDKPILGVAADALAAWLEAAGLTEGPIFRRLWGTTIGPGLSSKSVADIVQKRARLAGLEGDFGGHSLRSGFVTEGARQGVALPALMAMTDHRSVASVVGYFQAGGIADNPAAKLAGD